MNVAMDYRELPPPPRYDDLVKAVWTLDAGGSDPDWISRVATPDGCLEIIVRSRGRSQWNGEQPDCFLGGLIDQPARLEMRGDARFTGIRLWPWAAPMFGLPPAQASLNRWLALETADWLSVRGLEGALAVVAQIPRLPLWAESSQPRLMSGSWRSDLGCHTDVCNAGFRITSGYRRSATSG